MAIVAPIGRHIPARRIGVHEEASRVSAFLMLSLLIVGLAGLAVLIQSVDAPRDRAERPTRMISPPVGAPPATEPAAPSVEEQPASTAAIFAVPSVAPDAAPAGVPAPDLAVAAAAPPVSGAARIANTDGLGVVLYTAPRAGARSPRGLLEGASVTVVEASGADWTRVRALSGLDGWVPTRYLVADR